MASGAVYDAIREFLVANWTTTVLSFENEILFSDGAGPVPPADENTPWVAVEMTGTVYGQQSIGAGVQADNRWDEEGMLFLNVYVGSGQGSGQARTYAKSLADLFRGRTLLSGSLEFMDTFIGKGQPGEVSGNWYLIPVDIQWRRIDA